MHAWCRLDWRSVADSFWGFKWWLFASGLIALSNSFGKGQFSLCANSSQSCCDLGIKSFRKFLKRCQKLNASQNPLASSSLKKCLLLGEWPAKISFDHDLADEHYHPTMTDPAKYEEIAADFKEKTGMDCAKWLIDFCMDNGLKLPEYVVHSMNPSGARNIHSILYNFTKFQRNGNAI